MKFPVRNFLSFQFKFNSNHIIKYFCNFPKVYFLIGLVIILTCSRDCYGRSFPKGKDSKFSLNDDSRSNQEVEASMRGGRGGGGRRFGGGYGRKIQIK